MKVAVVVPGGLDPSGTVRVIPALLWFLERIARSCDVHAFALAPSARADRYELSGATVHAIGAGLRPARAAAAIIAEHRRGAFDVLHAFWATRCGSIAVPLGRALGVPTIVHLAGGETASLPAIDYGDARTARGRALLRQILRGADLVTAPSRPIVEGAARLGVEAVRVPLGVDRATWPILEPRPRTGSARLIHVASLNRVKDPFTLVAALGRLAPHHDFTVDLVGEDTLGGEVQAAVAGVRLEGRSRFHGFLPQDRLRPLVRQADIAIVSSLHEAGPVAALEAAHAGLAIAGTAVGHLAEWPIETAPPGDAGALARVLENLLADESARLCSARTTQSLAAGMDANATADAFLDQYAALSGAAAR